MRRQNTKNITQNPHVPRSKMPTCAMAFAGAEGVATATTSSPSCPARGTLGSLGPRQPIGQGPAASQGPRPDSRARAGAFSRSALDSES